MNAVSFGDIFLILVICGVIYGILALTGRGRTGPSKEKDSDA